MTTTKGPAHMDQSDGVTYQRLLRALSDANVRYILIGGMAVVIHGYPRFTQDMDIVLDLDTSNLERFLGVMQAAGLTPRVPVPPRDLLDPLRRREWIEEKNMKAFSFICLRDPFFVVDILLTLGYEEVPRTLMTVDGIPVPIVTREALIRMKKSTGRIQDLADAQALERIP